MPTTQLTDEEIAEVREIFDHYDKNKNGVIEIGELGTLLEALDAKLDGAQLAAAIGDLDSNNNGRLEFDEFIAWWADR
jgi:calmodulin